MSEGDSPRGLKLDDLVYEDLEPTENHDETKLTSALRMAVLDAMLSDEEEDDVEVQINKLLAKLRQAVPEQRASLWDELLDMLSTCSDDQIGLVIRGVSSLLESEEQVQGSYAYGILLMALDSYHGNMTLECLHQIITSIGNNFQLNEDKFSCFNIVVSKYMKEIGRQLRKFIVDILICNMCSNAADTLGDVVEWLKSMLQNENIHERDARKAVQFLENRIVLLLAILAIFDFEGESSVEAEILRLLEGTVAPVENAPLAFAFEDEKSFRLFFSMFVGSLYFMRLHFLLGNIFCLLVDSRYLEWVIRSIDSLEISLRTPFLCKGSLTVIRDMTFSCSARNAKAIIDQVFETLFQQVKAHVLAAELVQEIFANNLVSVESRINRLGWMNDLAEWIPETLQPELKAEMKLVLKDLVDAETEDPRHDPFFVAKMNRLLSE